MCTLTGPSRRLNTTEFPLQKNGYLAVQLKANSIICTVRAKKSSARVDCMLALSAAYMVSNIEVLIMSLLTGEWSMESRF